MCQGLLNHAALTKWHVKKRWMPFSSMPHLAQSLLICLEYLPALAPVGMAFLKSLHPKACTLGGIVFVLPNHLEQLYSLVVPALVFARPIPVNCGDTPYMLF